MIGSNDLVFVDVPKLARYEARLDDVPVGVLDYVVKRGRIALNHTEVSAGFEGRGIAARLARFALDDARQRELLVIVSCPYVQRYLETHPEDHDIVVGLRSVRRSDRHR